MIKWERIYAFFQRHDVQITPYYALYLESYCLLNTRYHNPPTLSKVYCAIARYLNEDLRYKALVDTNLFDAIYFSHAYLDLSFFLQLLKYWEKSVTTARYLDLEERTTIPSIIERMRFAIEFLLNHRQLTSASTTEFKQFLQYYFVARQLFDDLSDYKQDLAGGIVSYAISHGQKACKNMIGSTLEYVNRSGIPLYYKNVFHLHCKFFLR